MVLPSAIYAEWYRCFYEPVTLELRPLTLIYGRNNVGKSALLRLVPLLSAAMGDRATAPLDLAHPAARGASYKSLIWQGPTSEATDPGLSVGLRWEQGEAIQRVDYQIDYSHKHESSFVHRFQLWVDDDEPALDASWVPTQQDKEPTNFHYETLLRGGRKDPEGPIFTGLSPSWRQSSSEQPLIEQAARQLTALNGAVQWLQATRSVPQRLLPIRGSAPRLLNHDGSDALHFMYSNRTINAEVSHWYESKIGRRLELRQIPPSQFQAVLNPPDHTNMNIDLADAGEGMGQVLPLLVALAYARLGHRLAPKIVAVEEPESHLHPDAQRGLAEFLLEAVTDDAPPRILLETHSYPLLLAVQLGIARRPELAEHVLVYWVHQLDDGRARAERITFSESGQPVGNWPPGAFADQYELARQLVQLQIESSR